MRETASGLRGFFLADPPDLSLLPLVELVAAGDTPGAGKIYRIRGGNDRLATEMAAPLERRIRLRTAVVAVSQNARRVRVSLRTPAGALEQLDADYAVLTLPATLLRDLRFDPSLPDRQQEAIQRLKYGPATKTALQFARAFWRRRGRPRAYATTLPIGALWDGSEEQSSGRTPPAILTMLAGGSASRETRALLARGGPAALARQLGWLGGRGVPMIAAHSVAWEDDPWARGGYAYFDPAYDPGYRRWLGLPFGRVLFAGEHTSIRWQGYMNGAVESGLRVAAEVKALRVDR